MKHHLNTLYVTTQGSYLAVERETVAVRIGDETRIRVPMHLLEGIVCFGRVSVSPFLMARCSDHNVGISFLSENGRFLARVQGRISGNVLLRREQYRRADRPHATAEVARCIVLGKIATCRSVILRTLRDRPDAPGSQRLHDAGRTLKRALTRLAGPLPLDEVRGIEGDAARVYFGIFNDLIVSPADAFRFEGRTRRPPKDRVNAMLSFAYTLLVHDAASALEAVGLDPQVGYLHRDRPGRPSLALDLMEEFRPLFGDRLVLSLINRGQVCASDFDIQETGAVMMKENARKCLLTGYQERKQDEILHPFIGEKTTVGMLPHLQAQILARHLRGDLDAYPPFVWR